MIPNSKFLPIIGLEIHVEPKTKSKMFCGCDARHFQIKPNTHTCPVCLGLPGSLPVPNKAAIEACIKLGLALNCKINYISKFDRKNYFYPDLPKAYQISQYDLPFCYQGKIKYPLKNENSTIHITRIHMEEDTGKLIHKNGSSLIDYNRSGVPLIEIVTEPELHSATDAKQFLKELAHLIRWLNISDCDMEKGSMRLEANVSVAQLTSKVSFSKNNNKNDSSEVEERPRKLPPYKVELKNINSYRYLEKAINIEIARQTTILKKGQTPKQETRGYDEDKNITFSQRSKEEAQDYRYFPEPDIPPIQFTKQQINQLKKQIFILPFVATQQLVSTYQIRPDYAEIITDNITTYEKFTELIPQLSKDTTPAQAAQQIVNQKLDIAKLSIKQIIKTIDQAKPKFNVMEEKIAQIVTQVLKGNPKAIDDYKSGKTNALSFLTGQVMKQTRGQADPQMIKKLLEKSLT